DTLNSPFAVAKNINSKAHMNMIDINGIRKINSKNFELSNDYFMM
ncbi:hypothetical protein CEXT_403811, partial [Caerostris extrusa]